MLVFFLYYQASSNVTSVHKIPIPCWEHQSVSLYQTVQMMTSSKHLTTLIAARVGLVKCATQLWYLPTSKSGVSSLSHMTIKRIVKGLR